MRDKTVCYIGDGLIPQIERFASKYGYNKLTVEVMQTAINMMCQKAENPQKSCRGYKMIQIAGKSLEIQYYKIA